MGKPTKYNEWVLSAQRKCCDLTGIDPASFNLVSCSSPISPGGSENVSVNCEPLVSGSLSANLEMSTDDEDEPLIVIGLLCQGGGRGGLLELFYLTLYAGYLRAERIEHRDQVRGVRFLDNFLWGCEGGNPPSTVPID